MAEKAELYKLCFDQFRWKWPSIRRDCQSYFGGSKMKSIFVLWAFWCGFLMWTFTNSLRTLCKLLRACCKVCKSKKRFANTIRRNHWATLNFELRRFESGVWHPFQSVGSIFGLSSARLACKDALNALVDKAARPACEVIGSERPIRMIEVLDLGVNWTSKAASFKL